MLYLHRKDATELWQLIEMTGEMIFIFYVRFDDMYTLKLCVRGSGKKPARSGEMKKSIASWFDERGNLLTDLFHKELSRLHDSLAKPKKEM